MKSLAILLLSALCALGATNTCNVTLAWDESPSTNVVGYKVYWGTQSRVYTNHNTIAGITNTTSTVTNLLKGPKYFFAATAFSPTLESDYSVEIDWTYSPVSPPTNLIIIKVTVETAAATTGPWSNEGEFALVRTNAPAGDGAFYRAVMGIASARAD